MSVTITFYNNVSDKNVLNKSISSVGNLEGSFKTPFDIETPVITIEHSGIIEGNYCYIGELSRYYFIDKMEIITNNTIKLYLSIDVLMSFKDAILSLQCDIDNSSTNYDDYLSSPFYVATVKTKTDIIPFSSGFNDTGEYVLITAGG